MHKVKNTFVLVVLSPLMILNWVLKCTLKVTVSMVGFIFLPIVTTVRYAVGMPIRVVYEIMLLLESTREAVEDTVRKKFSLPPLKEEDDYY